MRLLLDTHIFLWFISGDGNLPVTYRTAIQNPSNDIFLSSASVWESVIKNAAGKLPLPMPPAVYLPQQRVAHHMASLAIDEGAMPFLAALPLIHRDPFDRILVAQNQQRGLTMLSVDPQVRAYPIPCLPY